MTEVEKIARGLSDLEREWFLQESWGSWVYAMGCDLISKGLTYQRDGNIYLTDLGLAVRRYLQEQSQ